MKKTRGLLVDDIPKAHHSTVVFARIQRKLFVRRLHVNACRFHPKCELIPGRVYRSFQCSVITKNETLPHPSAACIWSEWTNIQSTCSIAFSSIFLVAPKSQVEHGFFEVVNGPEFVSLYNSEPPHWKPLVAHQTAHVPLCRKDLQANVSQLLLSKLFQTVLSEVQHRRKIVNRPKIAGRKKTSRSSSNSSALRFATVTPGLKNSCRFKGAHQPENPRTFL